MPYDEPDETDPMQLEPVGIPDQPGATERMAEALCDEYARIGFDAERLMAMFRNPFFALMHRIWRQRGDAYCASVVERVVVRWRRR